MAGATGSHCVGPPGLEGKNPGWVLVCSLSGLRGHDALPKSQVLDTMRSLVQRQLHTPYKRMPSLLCCSNTPHVYPPHQPRRGGTTPCRGRQAPGRKEEKSSSLFPPVAGATGSHCAGPPGLEGENPGLVLVCSLSGLRGHDALRKSQVLDTMRSLVQRQLHTPYRRMLGLLC